MCEQTQGCNSAAVTQVMMAVLRDYSALSLGASADSLTRLASVSSHFTCSLLTAITCTLTLSGVVCHLPVLLYYFTAGGGAMQSIAISVSVCLSVSKTTCLNFAKFCVHVTCGRGSILL